MRIRHGQTVGAAITALDEIINSSQPPRNVSADEPLNRLWQYLNWIDTAQLRLRRVFADREVEDSLLSRGYWHIVTTPIPVTNVLSGMIRDELVFQAGNPGINGDSGGRLGEFASLLRRLR